jgi:hypothetical protein
MADLVIDPKQVVLVRANQAVLITLPSGGSVVAGQAVRAGAGGEWEPADASAAATLTGAAIAARSAEYAGAAVTCVKRGYLDVGDALAGLAFGATVYFSNAGMLSDTPGTVSKPAGAVVPALGDVALSAQKLLFVDIEG